MSNRSDIIIVGAGASGLMAARELSAKGKKVVVLEARNRAGGRIDTLHTAAFSHPVEAGAEFVHGNLPVTLQLLKEANIGYTKIKGAMLRNTGGKWHTTEEQVDGWDEMMDTMNQLQQDITLTQFLNTYFKDDQHQSLRQSALQYAQGFDAVDPDKASVFALRNEWQHEEEDNYRINGGYLQLIDALLAACRQQHCSIHFSQTVTTIEWQLGEVTIATATGETFRAKQVLVTVPVGILQSDEGTTGHIRFIPALSHVQPAAQQVGYGNVIKVLLQFSAAFWQEQPKALFFFTDQKIPTWWTQQPSDYPLLTGWLAGPKSELFANASNQEIVAAALQSLAVMFNVTEDEIAGQLTAWHVANWQKDVFAQGAYSYEMLASTQAKQQLREPVDNTVFFAGEALYSGEAGGTVEAALVSGKQVAEKILQQGMH